MNDVEEFTLSRPMPNALRIGLGAAGLFAIVAPAWEFRHAFLHPNIASLFFGFITLGAWSVGGTFVLAAIFGEDQTWRVRDGEITINRTRVGRRVTTTVNAKNLGSIETKLFPDSDGPDVYRVVLTLTGGEAFGSPAYEQRKNAEALEARLRKRLHLV